MKTTIIFMAFYLLLGSLFPKGDYTQLVRLVELGEHFRLHVQEANAAAQEVSFQRFLQMHYVNTQIHQGDHEQDHDNLPFQHIKPSFDQIIPLAGDMLKRIPTATVRSIPRSVYSFYRCDFPANIFHPPIG